ncbi:TonB-dependent siderophore receptor [Salinisphaera sp. Q1T1-3]|uniref:TonB-dependent receptor n=1 Tax=Salinisphaera sp. Q1T1-3 TaxID=2321229 RepID=UPI000E734DC9|nr:TonB-dependent receptor [Salinisphaera sp. Q1T1-3]RJS94855.1 TonB-dependent siderophore receptor [Salinisphaera sp. Q1T1-3]
MTCCNARLRPALSEPLFCFFVAALPCAAHGAIPARQSDNAPVAAAAPAAPATTTLSDVTVSADDQAETEATNRRVALGPLGQQRVLDTPFTVHRVAHAVVDDQQTRDVADALSFLPSVQAGSVRPQSRGMQGSVAQNSRLDGLNIVSTTNYPAQQFAGIQVLEGLAGALYGPASPAGTFNYLSKRPTDQPMTRVTIGYRSGPAFREALDTSGAADDDGRIRYRLNILNENGSLPSAGPTSLKRRLISLATDFHLGSATTFETTLSHYHYEAQGSAGRFAVAQGVDFPSAVDPARRDYGAGYAGHTDDTETAEFRLKHAFSDDWHLDVGFLRQIADRRSTAFTHTITDTAGDYTSTISTGHASRFRIESYLVHLNGVVHTADIVHHLTLGASGFTLNNFNPRDGGVRTVNSARISSPSAPDQPPAYPIFTDRYHVAESREDSIIAGDRMDLTSHWHVQLVASESALKSRNYDRAEQLTGQAHQDGLSTAESLRYTPTAHSALYVTHADSLQQGDTAPAGARNAGRVLPPARSREWEIGAKAAWSGVNYTLDAYQIRRPYALYEDRSYRQDGKQRNRGIDFFADGALTSRLHVLGGLSFLDARLTEAGDPAAINEQIVGLPKLTATVLLRYDVPHVPGLEISAHPRYFTRRHTTNDGSDSLPGRGRLDLGARYDTRIARHDATLRLNVDNVTDAHYWTTIRPGGLNGYTGNGSASAALAAPRTVALSMTLKL